MSRILCAHRRIDFLCSHEAQPGSGLRRPYVLRYAMSEIFTAFSSQLTASWAEASLSFIEPDLAEPLD